LESSALTVAELIGIRTAIAAGCGLVSSLTSDAKKKFLDGEDITLKQELGHAACQATATAAAALAGGVVAKTMVRFKQTTQSAAATLEGAISEPVSPLSDQLTSLTKKVPAPLAENATKLVIDKAAETVEKGLEDSVDENLNCEEHYDDRQSCTQEMVDAVLNATDTNKPMEGIVTYRSNGWWFSKMVVSYVLNGEEITQERRGSGRQIKIPSNASKIKVRFKALRPPWGDIIKYDRFQSCWCEPYEPHVFQYNTPPIRTFTISGNLWWEKVMAVIDEHFKETKEM